MSMEEWTGFELSEQVLDEATSWIARLDDLSSNGETSVNTDANETIELFNLWLGAHTQHQQAYAEMSLLWAKSACIHEISDRISASNVFALCGHNKPTPESDFAQLADEFKRKRLSILQACNQASTYNSNTLQSASPAWLYVASMGLIALGLLTPTLQYFLY